MTTDALLNVLLAFIIPFLMAAMGGILAARALPSDVGKPNAEKWFWIASFVVVFLVSVALAFVQQVRTTTHEHDADTKAHEKDLRDSGEIKYMQGQLDSIGKILGNLSHGSDPKQTAALLKEMLPILAASVPDVNLRIMYENQNLEGQILSIPFVTVRTGPGAPEGYRAPQLFKLSSFTVRNDGTRSSDPLAVSLCFSQEVESGNASWAKTTKDTSDEQFPYCIPMEQRKENPIVIRSKGTWDVPLFFGSALGWDRSFITAQVRIIAGGFRPSASTFTITASGFKPES